MTPGIYLRTRASFRCSASILKPLLASILVLLVGGCFAGSLTDRAVPSANVSEQSNNRELDAHSDIDEDRSWKIAVLLPLSGPHAALGQQLWDGAVLAVFDHGEDRIELLPRDTGGTPDGARLATEQAIADGADVVIGPLFSGAVSATKAPLMEANMRNVALSNNQAVAGFPTYLIGNHPENQIDALATYLAEAGRQRIGLLGPDTGYLHLLKNRLMQFEKAGKIDLIDTRLYKTTASFTDIANDVRAMTLYDQRAAALEDFVQIFEESWDTFELPEEAMEAAMDGIAERRDDIRIRKASITPDIGSTLRWSLTEFDYKTALADLMLIYGRKLEESDSPKDAMMQALEEFRLQETLGEPDLDAVILPVGGRPLLVIAPMFEYFNAAEPDIWLLGTDVWDSHEVQSKKDLFGRRYVTATSSDWPAFRKRVHDEFGYHPDRLVTAAYDAVAVALLERKETGRISFDEVFLTRMEGFVGINGKFRFQSNGLNERTLNVVQFDPDGPRQVYSWDPEVIQETLILPAAQVEAEKLAPLAPNETPRDQAMPISMNETTSPSDG